MCDIGHTVHSDELFVIRQHKRNGEPDEGVCDIQYTVHSDELFAMRKYNTDDQHSYFVCDSVCTKNFEKCKLVVCGS